MLRLTTVVWLLLILVLPGAAQAPAPPPVSFGVGVIGQTPPAFAPLRQAGARAVKIVADWSVIEARQGQFVWETLDGTVAAARGAQLQPVIVLAFTPRWASLSTGIDLNNPAIYTRTPPKKIADWERFVTEAVRRYRSSVREWQVWTVPNLPHFRGTETEYLKLVIGAQKAATLVDPAGKIVLASPAGMDLVHVRRAVTEAPGAVSIVSVTPAGLAPEQWLRPLATIRQRILRTSDRPIWIEWAPEPAPASSQAVTMRAAAVARALGVERLFLPADLIRGESRWGAAADVLEAAPFTGYLVRDPGVYALVFGAGDRAVLLAWSEGGERALEIPVTAAAKVVAFDGKTPLQPAEGKLQMTLDASPILVQGVPTELVEEARSTQQQRGPLVPIVAPDRDFSTAREITVRLGRTNTESGLSNILRSRRNGAVEVVKVDEEEAVRTNAAREIVFVYFDVDDTFLYFNDGRFFVDVTIEVLGARAAQTVGYNLFYDSQTGYKFTPWQWVEARTGWATQTIRLADANFANTWGWDFAVNAGGNRQEDLTIRSVTVRKVPR